jgi:phage tail P2-like protein
MLPWLAWAFGVEAWDTNWTDAQKRGSIASSLAVKRMKGTIGAVVASIQSLGLDAEVIEWFNQVPPGAPYTFDLVVTAEQDGFDQAQWDTLLAVVNHTKNVRSTLDELRLDVQSVATSYHGAAALMGLNITVEFDVVDTRGPVLLYVTANHEGQFGSIVDDSGYDLPLTYSGVGFDSGDSPYGDSSMYMGFLGERPMTTTLARPLGLDDFTLEFWVRPWFDEPRCGTDAVYLQLGASDIPGGVTIAREGSTGPHQLKVTLHQNTSITVFAPGSETTLPNDAWTHVALVGKAGNWSLFIAGRRVGTASPGAATSHAEVFIAGDEHHGSNYAGHLDDVRISAQARYDADFDPLTATRP